MSRRVFRFAFARSFCSKPSSGKLFSSINLIPISSSATRTYLLTNPSFSSLTGFNIRALSSFSVRSMSILASQSSALAHTIFENEEEVELLTGKEDAYDGVIVDMVTPMNPGAFTSSLRASISKWRQQGKKGIWIKLPIQLANLVQPAVEEGFSYHHAEPGYLMLANWISDTVNTLPENASHRVGVGAFVMNDKREVLAIQEKGGKFRGSGVWKFPTGVINQGEDIAAGAIREVKEETGIDTDFVELLGFRQSHKSFFGKSDLFFICMLRPLSFEIQKQDTEILEAKWMPIEEYADQSFVKNHELFRKTSEICLAVAEKGYSGFSPVPAKTGSGHISYLYLNSSDMNPQSNSDKQS